jgi:RNA recognition motif-containing protein
MAVKLYGRISPFSTTDHDLHVYFSFHVTVPSAQVILDRYTERLRGLGFVKLKTQEDVRQANKAFNGTDMCRRILTVTKASPPEDRRPLGEVRELRMSPNQLGHRYLGRTGIVQNLFPILSCPITRELDFVRQPP